MIWHGSDSTGSRSESGYCNAWRSSSPSLFGSASPFATSRPLLGTYENVDCSKRFIVLCIEVCLFFMLLECFEDFPLLSV